MLNGLDLFSGIGGISYALAEWVRPVAYCEIDAYATAVLLSRMCSGELPRAPIWDDVRTLKGRDLPRVDIIYGGFPCQDISIAGNGKGLEGERSGLFFEIMRLVDEIRPSFIFLENVPAITFRGLREVTGEITKRGYDSRWITLSASEIGANHKRNRWWLLGYSKHNGSSSIEKSGSTRSTVCNNEKGKNQTGESSRASASGMLSDTYSSRKQQSERSKQEIGGRTSDESWWTTEPGVGRVANGLPFRVDRIRGLGNAVVPIQAKEAFKILMGLNGT